MPKSNLAGGIVVFLLFAGGISEAASFVPKTHVPMNMQVTGEGPASEGVAPPAGHAWYKFAHHTHTTYSDGYATVQQRIQGAATDGADAVCILDHRTQEGCSDPYFTTINGCVPMCGEEWGWNGHLGMLNMQTGDPMVSWTLDQAIPEALSRGATLVVCHPKTGGGDPWPFDELHPDIPGVEVWSTLTYAFSGSVEATAWWNDFLVKGRIVFGLGGSDMHMLANTLSPCNYVLAASAQPNDLQQGIEAGRVTISADKNAARCFIWCDADRDGAFETPMGTSLPIAESRTLAFRIEVYSGQGRSLRVITKAGQAMEMTVGEGNPWHVNLEAPVGPATKDFLRAEVPDPADILNPMDCIANPIYVNYTRRDADSDGLGDSFELQIGTDMYNADSDGDGLSDAFEVGYDGNPNDYNPHDPEGNPAGTDLNARLKDTDGDGVKDIDELVFDTDPLDAGSVPVLPAGSSSVFLILTFCIVVVGTLIVTRSRNGLV